MDRVVTVCAVVVTYNRKELLIECLDALENQSRPLDAIYILDNASNDKTTFLLEENGYINENPPETLQIPWEKSSIKNGVLIHYVRMHRNTGGAGGFHEGVKRAYEKGYDWIWLMDDDAEPKKNALLELSKFFKKKKVSALATVVKNKDLEISIAHRGYFNFNNIFPTIQKPLPEIEYEKSPIIEIDFASFVGFLIKRQSIDKIGFPKKELFIHHDDVEYCIRLRKIGKIFLVSNSIIIHKDHEKRINSFLGRKYRKLSPNNLWITYFGTRNLVWIGKLYSPTKRFYIYLIIDYIKNIGLIIIFQDNKIKRIKLYTAAYIHGLNSNFNNEIPEKYK